MTIAVLAASSIPAGVADQPGYAVIDRLSNTDDSSVTHAGYEDDDHVLDYLSRVFELPCEPLAISTTRLLGAEHFQFETCLSDSTAGIQPVPPRPSLLVELNEKFLATGDLGCSVISPTGAMWRPSLWVFGEYRAGISHRDQPGNPASPTQRFTEAAHRLDLFTQLNLTGTERLLIGLRPLDEEVRGPGGSLRREFNAYDFHDGDWIDGWNNDIQTIFFEGDFGELFPELDLYDTNRNDYGFSIGRQPLIAQQGLLIAEDMLDAVTVTRNTLSGNGVLNLRMTGVAAWNRVSRHDLSPLTTIADRNSHLFALLTEADLESTTINGDLVFVDSHHDIGSMVAWGISGIQRVHTNHQTWNTSLHLLASHPTERETSTAGQGELLFARTSWTPHGGLDLIYVNGFLGIDEFTSPARGPLQGGPLGGSLGILFAHTGLGQASNPLSTQVANAAGASIGYQIQLDDLRRQVIFETGGRTDTNGQHDGTLAGAIRYQQACGQHFVWIVDGFVAKAESRMWAEGLRLEVLTKF